MSDYMNAILQKAGPEEIILSGWQDEDEIKVLAHKPSLYMLLAKSAIPNPLIPEVDKLFAKQGLSTRVREPGTDFARALVEIARACLVDPSMSELEENGIDLTDEQLLEIYSYATGGARALRTFRRLTRKDAGADADGEAVQNAAVDPDGD